VPGNRPRHAKDIRDRCRCLCDARNWRPQREHHGAGFLLGSAFHPAVLHLLDSQIAMPRVAAAGSTPMTTRMPSSAEAGRSVSPREPDRVRLTASVDSLRLRRTSS
jgi:hypothetical protein